MEVHPEEKTEVVYDQNEIIQRAVESYYAVKHTCDVCTDSEGPSIFVIRQTDLLVNTTKSPGTHIAKPDEIDLLLADYLYF